MNQIGPDQAKLPGTVPHGAGFLASKIVSKYLRKTKNLKAF
jgi:hypothetical protein